MSCRAASIGSLEPDQEYLIVHAESINTRYRQSVMLAIFDSPTTSVKVFLPKQYSDVVSDEDLQVFNSKRVALYLIYKGRIQKQTRTS